MKADTFWLYKGRALMGSLGLVSASLSLIQFYIAHERVHTGKMGWALVHGLAGLLFVRTAFGAFDYADKKFDEFNARGK
jgi:hypothetical protein